MSNQKLVAKLNDAIDLCNRVAANMEMCSQAELVSAELVELLEAVDQAAGRRARGKRGKAKQGDQSRRMWSSDETAMAIKLRELGWSYDRIGVQMGRSHSAVQRWVLKATMEGTT